MKTICGVVVILCMTLLSDAKVFKRCELAKELSQNTLIERSFISHCEFSKKLNIHSLKLSIKVCVYKQGSVWWKLRVMQIHRKLKSFQI